MTFDDEITAALRRDLQAAHVGFDAAGAEGMIRTATQADPLGERRAYAAPLAAAAAVVVIGGGVATFAATRGGGTATGGGPVAPVPCPTTSSSAAPSASASAPASEIPPVYTTPAAPPSTIYPLPTTPAASDLPLHLPSSTPVPSETASGSPTIAAVNGSETMTLAPVSTTPAAAGPSVTDLPVAPILTVPPTPASTSHDPCSSTEAPSAPGSDLPLPISSTPSPYIDCSPRDIDPGFSGCITFRVTAKAVAGGTSTQVIPMADVPHAFPYVLKTYVIDNPNADTGTVALRLGGHTLVTRDLGPRTGQVIVVDSTASTDFTRDDPVEVVLTCTNSQRACSPTVTIGARPVQPTTPPTGTPTHS